MRYSHNQVMLDGYLFDSEQEADYYKILKEKQDKGEISGLEVHPEFVLIPPFTYFGKQIKATVYTPDFLYTKPAEKGGTLLITEAIEVKGYPTPDFEIRAKLFKYLNPMCSLIIVQYSKATGWMERTDYMKARKKINASNAVDRYEKKKKEFEEKRDANFYKKAEIIEKLKNPKLTDKQKKKLSNSLEILRNRYDRLYENWEKEKQK